MQQFTNTLRLLYTRELNQDTTLLRQFLDIRLNNTETVDTRTEYVERVLDSAVHFLTQYLNHLFIRRSGGYFVLQSEVREHSRQFSAVTYLFVRLCKEGYKIGTAGFLFLTSQRHRLFVNRRIQDVRNGNLHGYVHTTLQVQTEVDLFLTALFERVTHPNFLLSDRIVINALCCLIFYRVLFGLTILYSRNHRERQVEGAYQHKAHRQCSNKSFVLHNFLVFVNNIYALFSYMRSAYICARHTKSAQNYKKYFTYARKK